MNLYKQFEEEKGCKWIQNPVYFAEWIKPKIEALEQRCEKIEKENIIMKETLRTFGYDMADIDNLFIEEK
jgi:CRISPR/Cas system-associated endoribonuclease Cas2